MSWYRNMMNKNFDNKYHKIIMTEAVKIFQHNPKLDAREDTRQE